MVEKSKNDRPKLRQALIYQGFKGSYSKKQKFFKKGVVIKLKLAIIKSVKGEAIKNKK